MFPHRLVNDPQHVGAHAQLATILRDKLPEDDLAALHRTLAEPDLLDSKRAILYFGLATSSMHAASTPRPVQCLRRRTK